MNIVHTEGALFCEMTRQFVTAKVILDLRANGVCGPLTFTSVIKHSALFYLSADKRPPVNGRLLEEAHSTKGRQRAAHAFNLTGAFFELAFSAMRMAFGG